MTKIDRKQFTSIAEAVAHYILKGYTIVDEQSHGRIMVNKSIRGEVIINQDGVLDVKSEEVVFY